MAQGARARLAATGTAVAVSRAGNIRLNGRGNASAGHVDILAALASEGQTGRLTGDSNPWRDGLRENPVLAQTACDARYMRGADLAAHALPAAALLPSPAVTAAVAFDISLATLIAADVAAGAVVVVKTGRTSRRVDTVAVSVANLVTVAAVDVLIA